MGKAVIRSFRLSKEAYDALAQEASRRGVSLNWLVDEMCMKFASYDRFFANRSFVKLSMKFCGELMDWVPREKIPQYAKASAEDCKPVLIAKNGVLVFDTILNHFRDTARAHGWEYTESWDSRELRLARYNIPGNNLKEYVALFWKELFESVGMKVKTTISGSTLVIKVAPPFGVQIERLEHQHVELSIARS
jgi:hypothetical protein